MELIETRFETLFDLQCYLFSDFKLFLTYALDYLYGFDISEHQVNMADFLVEGHDQCLILLPRSWSKSMTIALYVLWRCSRCPNMRVRIICSVKKTARDLTRMILNMARRLPVCHHLIKKMDRKKSETSIWWTCSTSVEKDANIECSGYKSSEGTGSRSDLIIYDDLETPATGATPVLRANLLSYISEGQNFLHPQYYRRDKNKTFGESLRMIIIGTPQTPFSIYKIPDNNEPHPLNGITLFKIQALDDNNQSTFPERWTTDELVYKKNKMFPYEWARHYMMDTTVMDEKTQILNMKIIREMSKVMTPNKKYCFVDPAYGSHDETAYTLAGLYNGLIYIFEVGGWVLPPEKAIPKLVERLKENQVDHIYLESNLPNIENIFKQIVLKETYRCKIESYHSSRNKEERMAMYLGYALNNGQAILAPKVLEDNKTVEQMAKFSDLYKLDYDDRLDSMSMSIQILGDKLRGNNGDLPPSAKVPGW